MRKRKVIYSILMILWMGIIFSFSAKNGEQSTKESNQVGTIVGKLLVPHYTEWTSSRQTTFALKIDHIIRKSAHAIEYAVLGLLIAGAYIDNRMKLRRQILFPWSIGFLYAITDEMHQLYVPGRSGQVSDVLLDSAGVLLGVMIVNCLFGFIRELIDKRCGRGKLNV